MNVRYVLEGSVQRSGNRIRVNVQLIDTETRRPSLERAVRQTGDDWIASVWMGFVGLARLNAALAAA